MIEEFKMLYELHLEDNERLTVENSKLKKKLENANDIILDKDRQIENLNKDIDEMKR